MDDMVMYAAMIFAAAYVVKSFGEQKPAKKMKRQKRRRKKPEKRFPWRNRGRTEMKTETGRTEKGNFIIKKFYGAV